MWKVQPNHCKPSLFAAFAVVVLATTAPSLAQFVSGSDGTDGAFNPTASVEVDLSLAASLCDCDGGGVLNDPCRWDCPSPVAGQGVYDAEQWAVVFKFTTIDIPVNVRVTFKNHAKGAPIVWLATGDVSIGGDNGVVSINVSGNVQPFSRYAAPGPGGFAGGAGLTSFFGTFPQEGSAGFGAGGGDRGVATSSGGGGSFGARGDIGSDLPGAAPGRLYSNPSIVPLIGGSGGGGSEQGGGRGDAGGGAILIASSGSMDLGIANAIRANGGFSNTSTAGGSGGAIRLIANTISGAGTLLAVGGVTGTRLGGEGRIRLEAFTIRAEVHAGNPLYTATAPGPVFPPAGTPTLKAVMVDSVPISSDPRAGVQTIDAEVLTNDAVTLHIEATNIAIGTVVDVIVTPAASASFTCQSTPLAGMLSSSTATVQFEPPGCQALPPGTSDIVLRAEPTP